MYTKYFYVLVLYVKIIVTTNSKQTSHRNINDNLEDEKTS